MKSMITWGSLSLFSSDEDFTPGEHRKKPSAKGGNVLVLCKEEALMN